MQLWCTTMFIIYNPFLLCRNLAAETRRYTNTLYKCAVFAAFAWLYTKEEKLQLIAALHGLVTLVWLPPVSSLWCPTSSNFMTVCRLHMLYWRTPCSFTHLYFVTYVILHQAHIIEIHLPFANNLEFSLCFRVQTGSQKPHLLWLYRKSSSTTIKHVL